MRDGAGRSTANESAENMARGAAMRDAAGRSLAKESARSIAQGTSTRDAAGRSLAKETARSMAEVQPRGMQQAGLHQRRLQGAQHKETVDKPNPNSPSSNSLDLSVGDGGTACPAGGDDHHRQ